MANETYASLHNHTDYSNLKLIDSINKVEELIDYAYELGLKAVAITDHECLTAHVRALNYYNKKYADKKDEFKLILGNEIYITREGLNAENHEAGEKFYHMILLAKDEVGHRQLRELSSRAWKRGYVKFIMRTPTYLSDLEDIIGREPGHVICTTACLGSMPGVWFLSGQEERIAPLLEALQNLFGDDFFIELQPSYSDDQLRYNSFMKKMFETDYNFIVATDSHYLKKEEREIHKTFLNSKDGKGNREVDEFYSATYMMSAEEIHSYMDEYLGADFVSNMMANSCVIADKCKDYNLDHPQIVPKIQYEWNKRNEKLYKVMAANIGERPSLRYYFSESEYEADKYLAMLVAEGYKNLIDDFNDEYLDRLEEEFGTLRAISEHIKQPLSDYFNTMAKIIDIVWTDGDSLTGPGRGCFVPGSKVTLGNGQTKNIEDIIIGDNVFTHKGRVKKVLDTKKYRVKETLYTLHIQGTEDITCTNNHKFWAIPGFKCKYKDNCVFSCKRQCDLKNRLQPRWIEAQDLQPNDMVAIPKYIYPAKRKEILDLGDYTYLINYHSVLPDELLTFYGNNTKNIAKKYKRFIPIDKDFMYFLGVFIGDGFVRSRLPHSEIGLCFNSETEKDQKSQERIENYLKKINVDYRIVENEKGKKVTQIVFNNPFLGEFLKSQCGDGVYEKHIPDNFLYDNREEMESLLYGLLQSDGHISEKEKRICYDTVNYNLAVQVRNLLSYLGIYSSTKIRPAHGNDATSYKVSSSGKQLELLSFINFNTTKNIVQRDKNYFYPRIEKIETIEYDGFVYDLSVEGDTSYIINNIAVHNSGCGSLINYLVGITQLDPLRQELEMPFFRFLHPSRPELPD